MNFKKRVNGSWTDTPHYIHKTDTDIITSLPAVIHPNDTTATVGLKGQTVQSSTPSPTSPVMPQGTGERTGNLWNEEGFSARVITSTHEHTDTNTYGTTLSTTIGKETIITQAEYPTGTVGYQNGFFFIDVDFSKYEIGDKVTLSFDYICNEVHSIEGQVSTTLYAGKNSNGIPVVLSSGKWSVSGRLTTVITVIADMSPYVEVRLCGNSITVKNIMLNSGTTALPYEPYGVKIPILNNSQTTPVYLGEVESTRRIKKLALTGDEKVNIDEYLRFLISVDNIKYVAGGRIGRSYCSHYECLYHEEPFDNDWNNVYYQNGMTLFFHDKRFTTIDGFKAYLAQQYAAGTPVTIWYVLANETTGIVNEPIRKIGDYADEVSGISIPTIAGANIIDVDTTLKPSEVQLEYKGWHEITPHIYPDATWLPTSWNEFRDIVRSGKAPQFYPVGTKLYENWGDDTSKAWIIVDYPNDSRYIDPDLSAQGYTNRVVLMEEKLNYSLTYDTKDAWMYVETALLAGSYRFTIPNYDVAHGGNKTYIFTSTADVPVGGQLTLTWSTISNPSAVQGYSSQTSETALFDVSISEWDGETVCTDLGTIKKTISDPDSQYGKINSIERARMSSDNYYQSGIRQWLNASEAANWWTPSNVFDRPYANRTTAGRLSTLDSDMEAVLATPSINCITNNIFESPSLDGTTFSLNTVYTVRDKLFLPSHTEVNISHNPTVDIAFEYYVNAQNTDRIKYRSNGTAYTWWTRVPTSIEAQRVNIVSTNGTWSNPSSGSTNGVAACCVIQ